MVQHRTDTGLPAPDNKSTNKVVKISNDYIQKLIDLNKCCVSIHLSQVKENVVAQLCALKTLLFAFSA